jgi:1-aminocyclopropane-1-carboxylate deaminase/D-cysteine desulfhydrase-like pyridoxal-dependent ACC family enzyme
MRHSEPATFREGKELTMAQSVTDERLSHEALVARVGTLPRERIAHLPTALEEMPRLREALGPQAPRLFVKRDDATGLAFGGNKVRHLEFRLGDIRTQGADTLVVANVAQSNHARLHTALAARFGLTNYLLKIPSDKDEPVNGNLLLDYILGARIVEASSADSAVVERELLALIARLKTEGRRVYSVPHEPLSKVAGTCGYLLAAVELLEQLDAAGARADHIFMAAGTSSAGLALAGKLLGANYRVHPVSVGPRRDAIEAYVCGSANAVADRLGFATRLTPDDICVHDEYTGERYGLPTTAGLEAIRLAGQREALVLDPVYTAKACAALIDQVRRGAIGHDETAILVHTGGLPIVFAYNEEVRAALVAETAPVS